MTEIPESGDPGIVIDLLEGECPVQGEGLVDGVEFYFRARGARWSLSIGGTDLVGNPDWYYEEPYGTGPYDAGVMSPEEAVAFLKKAVGLWRAGAEPMPRTSCLPSWFRPA
ncbi:hypothetical protein LAZ40_11220 [Cereibacter sphaeroides]|uniref:hypothetical protein n=1 Tax=Cereibacter sphaeroides TaxID=1063 RepID=UPI001F217469|nr:hypothetical protein [Cereibacter sphaeroides]MCE6959618.1 hypothetical protein [Cereibacter sphaeroides]MCE6974522.1 hypothetical protein [Cereibacter sphaeroides]